MLATIHAVMLTGRDDIETKLAALTAGFDDFLTKGTPPIEIEAKLRAAHRVAMRQRALHQAAREMYGLARRDELTGLFNRRFFLEQAERLLSEGTVSLVLFDLDDFKRINDTYGHAAGDRVLRDVGALFKRSTRSSDIIARHGGDEFVLLIPSLLPEQIEHVIERLATSLRALQWQVDGEQLSIGATTGTAFSHLLAAPTVHQLLETADRDLYKNKWTRKHPDQNPALYEYPSHEGPLTLLVMPEAPTGLPQNEAPAPVVAQQVPKLPESH